MLRELHPGFLFLRRRADPRWLSDELGSETERYQAFPYMIVERGSEASGSSRHRSGHSHSRSGGCPHEGRRRGVREDFLRARFRRRPEHPRAAARYERAVVQAAHAAKMPVFIHANGTEAQTFALDAGVDVIAHGLWHWNKEPKDATELMPDVDGTSRSRCEVAIGWQPTMQVLYGERDLFDPAFLSIRNCSVCTRPATSRGAGRPRANGFAKSS